MQKNEKFILDSRLSAPRRPKIQFISVFQSSHIGGDHLDWKLYSIFETPTLECRKSGSYHYIFRISPRNHSPFKTSPLLFFYENNPHMGRMRSTRINSSFQPRFNPDLIYCKRNAMNVYLCRLKKTPISERVSDLDRIESK